MKRDNNLIILLLFMLGCGLFVELNFRYWYAFMEQYMMFQTTSDYLVRHLTEPGGMVGYLTDFISMGFYYPLCAAIVIALIAGAVSYSFHRFLKACGVERSMLIAVAPATRW